MELENVVEIEIDEIDKVGPKGDSAYEVYLKNGGTLSEKEWLESLKGEQGEKGEKGDTGSVKFIVVSELPTENIDSTAIYMKPCEQADSDNTYEEYIYVNNNWELLGTTSADVDMTNYYDKEEIDEKIGSLDNLTTESKENLTSAINEINSGVITKLNGGTVILNDLPLGVYVTSDSTTIKYGENYTQKYLIPKDRMLLINYNKSGFKWGMLLNFGDSDKTIVILNGLNRNATSYYLSTLDPRRYTLAYNQDYDTNTLSTNNQLAYTPTRDYHPATKKYVDDMPTTYTGYDATKTQVLKNINGTLTWVDEE